MKKTPTRHAQGQFLTDCRKVCAALILASVVLAPPAGAVPDASITKEIWRLKYGVSNADLNNVTWQNADADGDGVKNINEAIAGTNPFQPGSVVKITTITLSGNDVSLTFPTVLNKQYVVQASATLSGFADLVPSVTTMGTDADVTLVAPKNANKFFRVLVQDIDTDGDGLSNWVELETGLNPNSPPLPASEGAEEHAFVLGQIALPHEVNIMASESIASEDGPTAGKFIVTRTQKLLPITVNLSATGTAILGTDYSVMPGTMLPGSVAFASGVDSVEINVNPVPNAPVEGSESVTATLVLPGGPPPPFTLGANSSATVIISDSTVPTGTGLLARYYDTAANVYADGANFGQSGTFTFTRVGVSPYPASTIVIPFSYNGIPALQVGHLVRLTFTSGGLNTSVFNNINYTVTAVNPGVNFTVGISGPSLPASYNPTGNFSIQSFRHPAVVERVDAVVNNDWGYGTPNDVAVTPNNPVDNYSTVFEGYLHPTTAGNYQFQLDADDKARVRLDLNFDGDFNDVGEDILEHGWDGNTTPETIGTFKVSAAIPLVVPGSPAARYKIRVEHVETTGDARCRLQWREGANGFANIPQANVFSHTRALTNYTVTSAVATINTAVAHGLTAGVSTVTLYFTAGSLFTPPANYSGTYTVQTTPTTTSFTISVPGAANQTATTGLMADSTSTTTGWLNQIYANTAFTAPPGYVNVVGAGATNANNGIWGSGTPDPVLIGKDTFSVRWSGQVQPQFSEDYTFVVQADDGSSLWINGQLQEMKTAPSTSTGVGTYDYSSVTGDSVVNYTTSVVKPGSFIVGETVRVDPTSGNLTHGNGSTYTFDGVTGVLTVNYSNLANITPGGFTVGETIELDPTSGSLASLSTLPYVITSEPSNSTFTVNVPTGIFDSDALGTSTINILDTRNATISKLFATGATYSYNSVTGNAVVTYSAVTGVAPSAFTIGMTVELDPTSASAGTLNTLTNAAYTITAATPTTFTVNIGTSFTTCTGNINIASTGNNVIPASITNAFAIGFGTGKYTTGTGNINVEIVNKPLKEWSVMGNERFVRIPMVGGTRYDIQLDYYENTGYSRCLLYWYSASQPKQIIPSERLYPASVPQAPAAHISPTDSIAVVGATFTYPVLGSNGGTVSVSSLPPGLTFSAGVISGTATVPGDYQILITTTNGTGTSTSVLNLHVDEASGSIAREVWTGIGGTSIASIPTSTNPSSTNNLTSLEAQTNFGDDYGARIRGYITAPVTGNYYFWIAASNTAELWISNDDEPVNAFKRASVITGNATPQTWSGEANQKSPWLALEAGRRYYIEILHKAGVGSGDNLAVGWSKPGEPTTTPSQVVPGYVLSPYVAPASGSTSGTLYLATMLSQNGAVTNGVGTATLRLSEDENTAIISVQYSGLSGTDQNFTQVPVAPDGTTAPDGNPDPTDWHVHVDPYLSLPTAIVYDGVEPVNPSDGPQPDGTHHWTIEAVGVHSKASIIEIIKQGKAYINLHSVAYPNGEIRGNYTLANGTRTFTPPPAPPSWTDDHTTNTGASRFLTQATFGPSVSDIAALKAMASYEAWIDDQFTKPASLQLPEVLRTENASVQGGAFSSTLTFNAWWWRSIAGDDQLRQRIAFALSEIHVVSAQGPLENNALATSYFYDKLAQNAFGNFRDILEDTTLTPSMGRYLDMLNNDKPDQVSGRIPNENYAREIKQLFSVGLYRMWPDGTLMLTSNDSPIDTYTQREIVGFAHVFTGWGYGYDGAIRTSFSAPTSWVRQMRDVPARHYTGPKRILNNVVLPGITSQGGQPLDPIATHTSNNYNDPVYENLPGQELDAAHDQLFNHPNTGPFICRQLIQRLVTSSPSRDYLYRVVQKFNDNGSGVRGDMKAVIKAILLDYEARSPIEAVKPTFGKQREPVMRVAAAARAFRNDTWTGTYSQTGTRTITVTTATPHKMANGNNVFLDFTSGSPAPWIGSYSIAGVTANTFTVQSQGWSGTANYSIPANSTTCTVTLSSHWVAAGNQIYADFLTVSAGTMPADGIYTVATSNAADYPSPVAGTTFTLTVAANASARTGTFVFPRYSPGSYTVSASGLAAPNDRRITMDTNLNHELVVGDQVSLNFYNAANIANLPNDYVATVESVVDLNTYTFLAPSAGTNFGAIHAYDAVYQFPLKSLPLTRSGNVGSRPSTFAVGSTTTELEQTPINSPTVFNYFLPDYKYAGTLASQGMTTPEFQITAETTVVRQANYLYNGVFGSGNTNGISSFNNGNHSLVMDFSPWFGNAVSTAGSVGAVLGAGPQTGEAWTSNANLSTLVDRLNVLLLGEAMPTPAKNIVLKFLDMRAITAISQQNPCRITSAGHNLNTGDVVVISGVTGGSFATTINTTLTVTKIDDNVFSVPVNCTNNVGINYSAAVAPIIPYNNTTPTDTNKRDRLRAIIHFILSSPDFTIQR